MRFVMLVLLAITVGACTEPLQFADWAMPVAEGVRVVGYAYTPAQERTETIDLVEDLVLGLDANDPNQAFYGVRDVDVDDDGNLWVLDAGNSRIQVFDAEGDFVRSIGREGQGPGELNRPSWLVVAGQQVLVRADSARLGVFGLDGSHLGDATFDNSGLGSLSNASGRADGTFYASRTQVDPSAMQAPTVGEMPAAFEVGRFSDEGAQLSPIAEIESVVMFVSSAAEKRPASVARPYASYAASRDGDVYATTTSEYQVLAFDPDGEPKWALRVAYTPEGLSDEVVERALEIARRRDPETTRGDLIWPERLPALSHLAVDGHGHVYVYPHFERGAELEERPVDVYSPDGELLFSGTILDRRWQRARGDFVYGAGTDRVSGELLVWRWRLVEPF